MICPHSRRGKLKGSLESELGEFCVGVKNTSNWNCTAKIEKSRGLKRCHWARIKTVKGGKNKRWRIAKKKKGERGLTESLPDIEMKEDRHRKGKKNVTCGGSEKARSDRCFKGAMGRGPGKLKKTHRV